MQQRFATFFSAVFLVLVLFPSSTFAVSASQALSGVSDEQVVTRGEFVRAAIQVLGLEKLKVDASKELPYLRVARGLEPYIRIADQKNALEAFGNDLLLSQGISRGDALRVLVNLTGFDTAKPAVFKDISVGTPDERAVRVAVERSWMLPLRADMFGVRRMLIGKEARSLLQHVSGEPDVVDNLIEGNSPTIKIKISSTDRLMNLPKTQILEAIWGTIQREYLHIDQINADEAAWTAAEGMVKSLGDKYTTFMRPLQAQEFQQQINGEVIGIGAQVEFVDGVLTIISPIKGSPAEAAGLLPGDQILKADGVDLSGMSFLDAVGKVRGPKGSWVKLTIRRNGSELDVSVQRDAIRVPESTISWQGDVLIVEISQFGRVTQQDLRPALSEALTKNPKGLILDLRSNPGGLLSAADSVMSLFVPKGTKYVEVHSRQNDENETTSGEQIVPDSIRVVVLINEGSASASEIVAAALQDFGRATIVGTKSFGKGTVQQVLQFSDLSSLKLTIAEWKSPDGRKIDGVGVKPDIDVGTADGRDAPMLKALDLLR